jgi:hypothetical protein
MFGRHLRTGLSQQGPGSTERGNHKRIAQKHEAGASLRRLRISYRDDFS